MLISFHPDSDGVPGRPAGGDLLPPLQGASRLAPFWLPHLQQQVTLQNIELTSLATWAKWPRQYLGTGISTQFAAPNQFVVHRWNVTCVPNNTFLALPPSQDLLSSLWYISAGSLEVLDGPLVVAILGRGDLVGGHWAEELSSILEFSGGDLDPQMNNPNQRVTSRSRFFKAVTPATCQPFFTQKNVEQISDKNMFWTWKMWFLFKQVLSQNNSQIHHHWEPLPPCRAYILWENPP